jgi:putative ABC transport system substrate-binding protein
VDRRVFLRALTGSLLAVARLAEAQQARKTPRIGFLGPGSSSTVAHLNEAFRQGLKDRGWVEGKNIVIDFRFADSHPERLFELGAELIRLSPDVIVAPATALPVVAKLTTTIPIVFAGVIAPVEAGLVESLSRPGGNITGVTMDASRETPSKTLEFLRVIVPKASRLVSLRFGGVPTRSFEAAAEAAASQLGFTLKRIEVPKAEDLSEAFASILRERAEALFVQPNPIAVNYRAQIAEFALKNRLPTATYGLREFVDAGGLLSYGHSLAGDFRQVASYVDKILKGAKPGDLPIEQPTKFELVINLKTAKALGLTIPQSLLQRADEVIE